MNPRVFDVQLLVALDALVTHRHVTRAARSIGLSQPAMSHALARLRQRFEDPLLVRTAGGMEPTARALELIGPCRDAIASVNEVFSRRPVFEPARAVANFVVRMGDANDYLLLPAILAEFAREAPGVSLTVRHLSPTDTVRALEEGSLDVAISAILAHPKSIRSARLMEDRLVCAIRRDHPAVRRPLSLDAFLSLRHIRVVQEASDVRFVDEQLLARGLERNVVATIPHWIAALHAVSESHVVTATPERLARRYDAAGQLALRRLPLGGARFHWRLYWHRRHEASAAHTWLRSKITAICGAP